MPATCSLAGPPPGHCCWSPRWPRQPAGTGGRAGPQAAGLAGLAAGLLTLIVAGAAGSVVLLFTAMAVAGAGQGLAFMGGIRRVNEIAPADSRAGTVALFYVVTYLGSGLVTAAVGLLATRLGLTTSVQLSAAVLAAACLIMLAGPGRAPRRNRPGPAPRPAPPAHQR